jgi:hypothetical protein
MHNTMACRNNAVPGPRFAAAPREKELNRTVVAEICARRFEPQPARRQNSQKVPTREDQHIAPDRP